MNDWVYEGFRETYDRLGCRFDRWYFESETWQLGKAEVERGLGLRRLLAEGGRLGLGAARAGRTAGQDRPAIQRDIGLHHAGHRNGGPQAEDFGMDRSLYVVGAEQVLHFKNLFAILKALGYPWADGCTHVAYGLVTLPRGMGKLKSREGTAVDADDLLDLLHEEAKQRIVEGGFCGDDPGPGRGDGRGDRPGGPEGLSPPGRQRQEHRLRSGGEARVRGGHGPRDPVQPCADLRDRAQGDRARRGCAGETSCRRGRAGEGSTWAFGRSGRIRPLDIGRGARHRAEIPRVPVALGLANRQLSAAPIATYLLDLTRAFARFYHEQRVLEARGRADPPRPAPSVPLRGAGSAARPQGSWPSRLPTGCRAGRAPSTEG